MLLASAALVVALLGVYFLAPVVQLRYHAWRYHSLRDSGGVHLKRACELLVSRRATAQEIQRVLGNPDQTADGALGYFLFPPTSATPGYAIRLTDGKATSVERFNIIISPQQGNAHAQTH